mmetsp:Transcript_24045/g.42729  ORF Transcript_24045/g.42729 Transcript_24045/m.42729 type:complete len:313 (-) Transcript_24045:166-1104(-)
MTTGANSKTMIHDSKRGDCLGFFLFSANLMTSPYIMSGESGKLLKRLKFYCHMCKKHCRDADGFKCHKQSQSHQRNMLEFMQNPNQYIDQFSSEFKEEFMRLLSHRWPHSWVLAVKVHHCTLSSRKQVHLNATVWETLTDFVNHIQQEELVEVQQSEEGVLVKWIDHSPRLAVSKKQAKKTTFDLAKELEKLGAKNTIQVSEASEILPHQELIVELAPMEKRQLKASAFATEEPEQPEVVKASNLDAVLREEATPLDLKGAVFKFKSGPLQAQKAVVVRSDKASYLLKTYKSGDSVREHPSNLENVLPVRCK